MPVISCHPKGTFALQGIVSVLKDHSDKQCKFLEAFKSYEAKLFRNKDGSYLMKKIFSSFSKAALEGLTTKFKQELQENLTNKYSICIFKEIVNLEAGDEEAFKGLINDFLQLFPILKLDTCYHFGLQYLIEVVSGHQALHERAIKSAELAECLTNFCKNPKHIMKSRSTADSLLLSLAKPPSDVGKP